MHLSWTKHLKSEPSKQADFTNTIKSAWPVLARLLEILEEEDEAVERWITSQKTFDNPNWGYKLAFVNGDHYRKERIKDLIMSIKNKETRAS